ncbi:MAG: DsrE family protein [Desulfobacter sp.]|nr:MAG: DsrE family protein [Desulfobacter sp.]
MTEVKQEKIMYFATCGGEDPEKAAMPFVMASAALAMDIQAIVVLQGNGVYLAQKQYRKNMLPSGGFPNIEKLVTDFLELGGELLVCMPCIKERNIGEDELPEGAKVTAAGQLNIAAIEADAIFVY